MSQLKGKFIKQSELDHTKFMNIGTLTHPELEAAISSAGFPYDNIVVVVEVPNRRQMPVFGGKLTVASNSVLRIAGKVRVTP